MTKIRQPTSYELLLMMSKLSDRMVHVAVCMDYFDESNKEITEHALELSNASRILDTWIDGIRGDDYE